jgi:hypothetical protein
MRGPEQAFDPSDRTGKVLLCPSPPRSLVIGAVEKWKSETEIQGKGAR